MQCPIQPSKWAYTSVMLKLGAFRVHTLRMDYNQRDLRLKVFIVICTLTDVQWNSFFAYHLNDVFHWNTEHKFALLRPVWGHSSAPSVCWVWASHTVQSWPPLTWCLDFAQLAALAYNCTCATSGEVTGTVQTVLFCQRRLRDHGRRCPLECFQVFKCSNPEKSVILFYVMLPVMRAQVTMHDFVTSLVCEVGQQGVKIRGLRCTEAENRTRQRWTLRRARRSELHASTHTHRTGGVGMRSPTGSDVHK